MPFIDTKAVKRLFWRPWTIAGWILSSIVVLFVPSVSTSILGSSMILRLAQFVATIFLAGIMVFSAGKGRNLRPSCWWGATLVALILSLAVLGPYIYFRGIWRFEHPFDKVTLVFGAELTQPAKDFVKRHNYEPSPEEFVKQFPGDKITAIWTRRSIARRELFLIGLYVLCAPLFICTAILLSFALNGRKGDG